ncbi:MAG: class I SAM-dependent methyltransferase [Thermoanaerobaculia bacterium]
MQRSGHVSEPDTRRFYDDLADLYDLIYEDWPRSIERQADALDTLIRELNPGARVVADVACGIGTQSLGLAARGFEVIGSDLSSAALSRAEREARARNVHVDLKSDDMATLATYAESSVDALIACDNAVPHLLSDEQIAAAFGHFLRVLRPGGACVLSVRDYAALPPTNVRFVPFGVRNLPGGTVAIFQVWTYEGEHYDLAMYFVFDIAGAVDTRVFRARYYAVSIDRLMALLRDAGFADVRRLDDRMFQPVIAAVRPRF